MTLAELKEKLERLEIIKEYARTMSKYYNLNMLDADISMTKHEIEQLEVLK